MKLSEKWIQKVLDDVFLICDEETGYIVKHWMPTEDFEPDDFDFDGVVVMPVYDAKILATALTYLNGWCQESYQNDIRKLNKRIDKAEGK